MRKPIRRYALRTVLLLAVFVLFWGAAVGVFGVGGGGSGGEFSVRPGMLANPAAMVYSRDFIILFIIGLILSFLLPILSPITASVAAFASMIPNWIMGFSYGNESPALPMEYGLLTILMLFSVDMLASYFEEVHGKQKLTSIFQQFVPPELVGRFNEDPEGFTIEGEAREMTVLFCDIRNFTSLAENLDPKELVRMLNGVFDPLTEIIHRHLGTIDKYMGDAVMAFWGAPLRDPEHACNGVLAALEIQQALNKIRGKRQAKNLEAIHMGVGINTGVVNVGNMGSRYRIAYTVVGDAVNLAARLEGLTRILEVDTVVGESTRNSTQGILFREIGIIKVKGKHELTKAYEPICRAGKETPAQKKLLDDHARALECYYKGHFDEATKRFGRLWEEVEGKRLYELYLENIAKRVQQPIDKEWQGELEINLRYEPGNISEAERRRLEETSDHTDTIDYVTSLRHWKHSHS